MNVILVRSAPHKRQSRASDQAHRSISMRIDPMAAHTAKPLVALDITDVELAAR